MKVFLFLWGALISSCVFFQTTDVLAQKIRLLACYDPTDVGQKQIFFNDVERIQQAFRDQAGNCLEIYSFETNSVFNDDSDSPYGSGDQNGRKRYSNVFEELFDALDQSRVGADDALVVYWSGHGFIENGEHFLVQSDGVQCSRKDLLEKAKEAGARLTVLLTDSCANDTSIPFTPYVAAPIPPPISPLFQELFLNYRGVLDVNASSPGEKAYSCVVNLDNAALCGGCFSLALSSDYVGDSPFYPRIGDLPVVRQALQKAGVSFDQNVHIGAFDVFAEQTPSWDEVLQYVRETTDYIYRHNDFGDPRQFVLQPRQTIWVREKPTRIPGRPKPTVESGYDISVQKHFNSLNWSERAITRPVKGDLIVAINGRPVRNAADVKALVDASPSKIVLTGLELGTGRVFHLRTTLLPRGNSERLGLYVEDDPSEGALVVGCADGYPITRCQIAWEDGGGFSGGQSDDDDKLEDSINFDDLNWSKRAITRPVKGDLIVAINGRPVRNAADVNSLVDASSSKIVLTGVELRTGRVFYLRTALLPSNYSMRLGLYVKDGANEGAYVVGCAFGYPITRCQIAWEDGGGFSDGQSDDNK